MIENGIEPSDRELVGMVINSNPAHFRLIIDRYQRLVEQITLRMAPDPLDREDLSQEIFIRVYQSLPRFRHESKLSTWIAQIAINYCLNWRARRKLPAFSHLDEADLSAVDQCQSCEALPDKQAEIRQKQSLIWRAIDDLPPLYGLVISLYHLQEMSYDEIGCLLSLPAGTVKSHLFRARAKLKLMLQESLADQWRCA